MAINQLPTSGALICARLIHHAVSRVCSGFRPSIRINYSNLEWRSVLRGQVCLSGNITIYHLFGKIFILFFSVKLFFYFYRTENWESVLSVVHQWWINAHVNNQLLWNKLWLFHQDISQCCYDAFTDLSFCHPDILYQPTDQQSPWSWKGKPLSWRLFTVKNLTYVFFLVQLI